jgi:hypothetical protein
VGAVCGKAARTALCGGREVTRVPTASASRQYVAVQIDNHGEDRFGVISLGGDRGRGPVYVRSTSDRVEVLCTAVKDAKCQKPTHAPQQTDVFTCNDLLDHLVGAAE